MLPHLGKTDIYLIDQLMKGRITTNMRILDAGCGDGRNSEYFIRNNFDIWGFDQKKEPIQQLKETAKHWNPSYDLSKFTVASLENPPFTGASFDYIISSAVLHFAKSREHFIALFEAMVHLLQSQGILWIRMTAKHTIDHLAQQLHDDIYLLPDGSTRYLLDQSVLLDLMKKHHLEFLDPFKTTNVSDIRTMSTIVLQKN